ncbi:hypothetical protein [Thiothrix fructosivorans]|uniref:Uncharacterized protein n=1 Tax=Thiothrix fructosivorans TaxID=111770 RepID=A0A8B0SLK4_9GAMM|nr:hypothetical protein [Thiothrix fructosivorans]MBO0612688.1 hypothetical protein [Thiothrix fructosivorans]QTX11844.1 hypothetical protein J1836_005765 [Thiothrix fructosivorans]
MKAQHLLAWMVTTLLSSFTWANDSFQNQHPPITSNIQLQSQAVQVYTLSDGRFHAEINYQDQANATRTFTFEGSKEEIRQQLAQVDLPEERKQAVLQALEMRPDALFGNVFGNGFPFGHSPFGGKDPFDDPFFKNSPLNDEFFQQFFQDLPSFGAIPDLKPDGQQAAPPEITLPAPEKPVEPDATQNRERLGSEMDGFLQSSVYKHGVDQSGI